MQISFFLSFLSKPSQGNNIISRITENTIKNIKWKILYLSFYFIPLKSDVKSELLTANSRWSKEVTSAIYGRKHEDQHAFTAYCIGISFRSVILL